MTPGTGRSRLRSWGLALALVILGSAAVLVIALRVVPRDLLPERIARAVLTSELRYGLPRKFPGADLEIDIDSSGRGISVLLMADDLTPATERGRFFESNEDRARSLVLAFLAENPELFLQAAHPGVELSEERIISRRGVTDVTYVAQIAAVRLKGAWISGGVRDSGEFVTVSCSYPVLSGETIGRIRAAVARSRLTKEDVLSLVEADRRRTTPDATIAMAQAEKLAFPAPPYVRWELGVLFKGEETIQQGWSYEVDGVTGGILRRAPPFSKRDEIALLQAPAAE